MKSPKQTACVDGAATGVLGLGAGMERGKWRCAHAERCRCQVTGKQVATCVTTHKALSWHAQAQDAEAHRGRRRRGRLGCSRSRREHRGQRRRERRAGSCGWFHPLQASSYAQGAAAAVRLPCAHACPHLHAYASPVSDYTPRTRDSLMMPLEQQQMNTATTLQYCNTAAPRCSCQRLAAHLTPEEPTPVHSMQAPVHQRAQGRAQLLHLPGDLRAALHYTLRWALGGGHGGAHTPRLLQSKGAPRTILAGFCQGRLCARRHWHMHAWLHAPAVGRWPGAV